MLQAAFVMIWLGFLVASGLGQASAEEDLSVLVTKTKDAVVQLTGYDANGKLMKVGNAVFISPEGHLLTQRSIILGPSKMLIRTGANHDYPVKAVLAEDKATDLVKLQVDQPGAPWPFLKMAAAAPNLGSRVMVLGYGKKMESTVHEGLVSSVRDFLGHRVIVISAPIPAGAEGAAVVNLKGEMVGVAGSGTSEGQRLDFAIPASPEFLKKADLPQSFADWAAAHAAEASESYVSKAAQALRKGDNEWALTHSQRAVGVKPDNAQAHYYLGQAYLLAKRPADAEKELEILAKLDAKLAERLKDSLAQAVKAPGEGNLPELIKKAKPAVVLIQVQDISGRERKYGSGFFVNGKGGFITNYHVLGGAARARVRTLEGKTFPVVRVLAEDKASDLILASVVPDLETPFLKTTKVVPQVGEKVLVLGNPKGLEWSAADGIVSAVREKNNKRFIQISAPISPGSSGGPVMNMQGQVVGVNTFFIEGGQMLNFASAGQNILALKPGPGLTLEQRAEGWLAEAKDLVTQGRQAMQAKDLRKAVGLFGEAKKTYFDLPDPYVELVLIYLAVNDVEAAKEELGELRKVNPKVADELIKAIQQAAAKDKKRSRRSRY
ncbi:MAG: trypsin-like peptidase domain-containing protein [Desulfobaccales bacterium]